ncbi:MAG TPA: helix-turn-helix domain-containing protein [Micromonosporaceae bacterium]|jgi:transcriptional regulator with XRE-family HTH domain
MDSTADGAGRQPASDTLRTATSDPATDPPPVTIRRWTGVEIRALRAATRLSVREFARSLGVSDRIVSRWESAGRAAILRPSNQARLDMFLASATTEQKARFLANLTANDDTVVATTPARTRRVVDVVAAVKDALGRPDMRHALAVRDVATVFRILNHRGISQRQIAAHTGQSQSEISEILAGRRVLSYDLLARIADGLEIPRGHMGLSYDESTAPLVSTTPSIPPRHVPRAVPT